MLANIGRVHLEVEAAAVAVAVVVEAAAVAVAVVAEAAAVAGVVDVVEGKCHNAA